MRLSPRTPLVLTVLFLFAVSACAAGSTPAVGPPSQTAAVSTTPSAIPPSPPSVDHTPSIEPTSTTRTLAKDASQIQLLVDFTGELTSAVRRPTDPLRVVDDSGFRRFTGEPTADLIELDGQIAQFLPEHPETYAGWLYFSDYSGIEIMVKEGSGGQHNSQLLALINSSPAGKQVHFTTVPYSNSELLMTIEQLDEQLQDFPGYFGAISLPDYNAVLVLVSAPKQQAPETFDRLQKQLAATTTLPVPILVQLTGPLEGATEPAETTE